MKRFTIILSIGMSLLLCAGCRTSESFRLGAASLGPRVAARAEVYAGTDGEKILAARQLKADTSVLNDITFTAVEKDWAAIRPFYFDGVSAEPSVTPTHQAEKKTRGDMGAAMDDLIGAEKARPLRIFGK